MKEPPIRKAPDPDIENGPDPMDAIKRKEREAKPEGASKPPTVPPPD